MAVKAVLDTNILVSALINEKGKPRKILGLFYDRKILVYYSDGIIEEYKEVLSRKEFDINPEKIGKVVSANGIIYLIKIKNGNSTGIIDWRELHMTEPDPSDNGKGRQVVKKEEVANHFG